MFERRSCDTSDWEVYLFLGRIGSQGMIARKSKIFSRWRRRDVSLFHRYSTAYSNAWPGIVTAEAEEFFDPAKLSRLADLLKGKRLHSSLNPPRLSRQVFHHAILG